MTATTPTSTAAAAPTAWFAGLDGLRAIAAFLIIVHHAGFSSGLTFRSELAGLFFARMDIGVSIFFVLSGFLLYRPFVVAQFADMPPPATGPFWIRRLVRIYPGYWVAYLFLLVVGAITVAGVTGFVVSFGLVHIYHPDRAVSGMTQSWSLATELGFYLLLPWLARVGRRLGRGSTINRQAIRLLGWCVALAFASFVFRSVAVQLSPYPYNSWGNASRLWTPSYLDVFAAGMAIAVVSAWSEQRTLIADAMAWLTRRVWPWYAAAVVSFWFVSTQLGLEAGLTLASPRLEFARQTLYLVVGVCLVVPIVFGPRRRSPILTLLSSRVMTYLGVISYGVYLWHQALLTWTHDLLDWPELTGNFLVLLVTGSFGSVAFAAASHRFLEAPLMEWTRARIRARRAVARS